MVLLLVGLVIATQFYCYSVLVGLPMTLAARLDGVLRSAARLIGSVPKYAHISGYNA